MHPRNFSPQYFSPQFLAQLNDYWEQASLMALHKTYLYDNPQLQPTH